MSGKLGLAMFLAGGRSRPASSRSPRRTPRQIPFLAQPRASRPLPLRLREPLIAIIQVRLSNRAVAYYQSVWCIDSLSVKWAESGEMIRFTYRVVDPKKAELLNDKKVEPHLIDQRAGVSLMVPTLEKVGQLRQTSTPEMGRSYWMAFSNSGRPVKRGDHLDVVVGMFRAVDLVFE